MLQELKRKLPKVREFLAARGAELLEPTNQWEILRFRTSRGVSIVYGTAAGRLTLTGESQEVLEAFRSGKSWDAGVRGKRRSLSPLIKTLLQRDGDLCFLCVEPMPEDDTTIDHLCPVNHGGPNHISNLVLMHSRCNQRMGHQPAMTKILERERHLIGCKE